MPKIKIIFVDIDWTILNHKYRPGRFDYKSIKYLKKLQNKGIKVFICTARPYHSVKQIHFFNLFKPDGMILANGALIINEGKIIYQSEMPVKDFEMICDLAKKHKVNLEGIRPYDCFLISEADEAVHKLFATYPELIPPTEDYHNQKVIGGCLFASKEFDAVFAPFFPANTHYFRYHDYGVDIGSEPHIKGVAIKYTLAKLGYKKEEAVAIGDDYADISMFQEVSNGVAMGNALEDVKKEAQYITKPVWKHGVKYILKRLTK